MTTSYDSIFFPVGELDDKQLVSLLTKVRSRSVLYGNSMIWLAYRDGTELEKRGEMSILSKDPLLEVRRMSLKVMRMDCVVSTVALKSFLRECRNAKKGQRTLIPGLSYVEILKKHPNEISTIKVTE